MSPMDKAWRDARTATRSPQPVTRECGPLCAEPQRAAASRSCAVAAAKQKLNGAPLILTEIDADFATQIRPAESERWGDAVIVRKEFPASYTLAVVIDDAVQGVTHVTRGQDLLAATDLQRLLRVLLGLSEPVYHHHRLILDSDGGLAPASRVARRNPPHVDFISQPIADRASGWFFDGDARRYDVCLQLICCSPERSLGQAHCEEARQVAAETQCHGAQRAPRGRGRTWRCGADGFGCAPDHRSQTAAGAGYCGTSA